VRAAVRHLNAVLYVTKLGRSVPVSIQSVS
jgi:hypothetical protein